MLASDDNNPNFHGARNPDSALHVRFYSRPIQNNFRTQQEGTPIFDDVDYVTIHTPGNQLNIVDTPAREDHKRRFPLQWAHYQNTHGKDSKITGTPINQWPLLTAGQAETLKGLGFMTVQQLAFASDEQIGKAGMHGGMAPMALRDRAKRFLEAAAGDAALNRQAEELKKRDDRIAELEAKMNAILEGRAAQPGTQQSEVNSVSTDLQERVALAAQYEAKHGKKPHHKLSIEKLREAVQGVAA